MEFLIAAILVALLIASGAAVIGSSSFGGTGTDRRD